MAKKVALALDEEDILELEVIVRDQDKEAALDLVRELKRRTDAAPRSICGQGIVAGTQPS